VTVSTDDDTRAGTGPRRSARTAVLDSVVGFYQRRPSAAYQSGFAAATAVVTLLVLSFDRPLLVSPTFASGILLVAVATAAAFFSRLPESTAGIALVTGADFLAVALMSDDVGAEYSALTLLVLFPALWLAFERLWVGVIAAVLASLAVVVLPALLGGGPFSLSFWLHVVLLPFLVGTIAGMIALLTEYRHRQDRLLAQEQARLTETLTSAQTTSLLLETVLNTIDTGVLVVDASGAELVTNRRQQELLDLARPEHEGEPWAVYDADRVTLLAPDQLPSTLARNGEVVRSALLWFGRERATQRALLATSQVIHDSTGALWGAVVAYTDITDLVAAMQVKDDFVSTVSHELRTPLTSIIGYLELIEEGYEDSDFELPDEVHGQLEVVARNASRLLALVSDLLTTAQHASGTMSLRLSAGRLDEITQQSLDGVVERARGRGVELRVDVRPTPVQMLDQARITQVLDNLFSNALKYTPRGGTVEVDVAAHSDHTSLRVRDTGIGMSENDVRSLFAKFFRAESARRAAIPGVGLGLVICKAIVEGHGGSIVVDSTLGRGSTFEVRLPLTAPHPQQAR
jgi:two-component system phosphate regulon sensor histidine kinase PhoR